MFTLATPSFVGAQYHSTYLHVSFAIITSSWQIWNFPKQRTHIFTAISESLQVLR